MPFEFQPYENRSLGAIVELMQGPARARAAAARAAGEARARSAQIEGQTAAQLGGTLADIAGRTGAQIAQYYSPEGQTQRLQLQEQQRAIAEDQALRRLFSRRDGNGNPVTARPEEVYQIIGPKRGADVLKGMSALSEQNLKTDDAIVGKIANLTAGILALPEPMQPQAYALARQHLVGLGIDPRKVPEQYSRPFVEQAQQSALTAKDRLEADQRAAGQAETKRHNQVLESRPVSLAAGGTLINPQTQAVVASAPERKTYEQKAVLRHGKEALVNFDPRTGKSFDPASGADVSDQVTPMPPAAMRVTVGGPGGAAPTTYDATRPDAATGNKVDPRTGFTPNALYQNAVTFALEGKIPPMGMGSRPQITNARLAIQNKAGAIAAKAGVDLPTVQAEYRANSAALSKLLPQAQATANFANTAKDNLGLALQQSPKVSRTDSAWINQTTNAFVRGATSAASLTKFETYIYTAAREYAKVTSGGALSAQALSDSAAKEASKLLNAAQSPDAFKAAVSAMQDDMDNVIRRQSEGLRTVSGTIANFFAAANDVPMAGPTSPTSAPSTTPGISYQDYLRAKQKPGGGR